MHGQEALTQINFSGSQHTDRIPGSTSACLYMSVKWISVRVSVDLGIRRRQARVWTFRRPTVLVHVADTGTRWVSAKQTYDKTSHQIDHEQAFKKYWFVNILYRVKVAYPYITPQVLSITPYHQESSPFQGPTSPMLRCSPLEPMIGLRQEQSNK